MVAVDSKYSELWPSDNERRSCVDLYRPKMTTAGESGKDDAERHSHSKVSFGLWPNRLCAYVVLTYRLAGAVLSERQLISDVIQAPLRVTRHRAWHKEATVTSLSRWCLNEASSLGQPRVLSYGLSHAPMWRAHDA
jgi:hypothetical protein